MSEAGDTTSRSREESAGALLRAARQAQGLHIAALATMLKVPPRKLEALEADRHDEFQGATFVRALAQAACRALKIDPAPVLDRLPDIDSGNLSQLERGLNAPFRERGARREGPELPGASLAALGVVALLLAGALAFWLLPAGWRLSSTDRPNAAEPGTVTEPMPAMPPGPQATPAAAPPTAALASAPASSSLSAASAVQGGVPAAAQPASLAPASATSGALQLRARQASWVEVADARGQLLIARTLAAGEAVGLDGVLPLRVKIGNVAGTELSFRGQPVTLSDHNGDNVAKLELQ